MSDDNVWAEGESDQPQPPEELGAAERNPSGVGDPDGPSEPEAGHGAWSQPTSDEDLAADGGHDSASAGRAE